ncbi:putative methyltransferase, chloroplastic [Zostera marina]|uniref:Putative methyltransferase, chloroplastic n=1 Tax=Zostera marina TaxID=29655 RepID=A0A0K9PHK0_ZOSMR|nr:putative methyltransferase, chloroplastic [Zostera marina]
MVTVLFHGRRVLPLRCRNFLVGHLHHNHLCTFDNLKSQYRPKHVVVSASNTQVPTTALVKMKIGEDDKSWTNLTSFACPICYNPFQNIPNDRSSSAHSASLECNTCKKSYKGNGTYLDLIVTSGSEEYTESVPPSTELFRTPLVSFLYERGWRQNFIIGGFPGPEKEFEMAKDYLKPTFGGTIVDASCGSGLFSRMFSKSKLYKAVVALDFSENMLRQCDEFVKKEGVSTESLILVRADICRLPFASTSVDAVHAGAALHCWPSPSSSVAEISRILRPGGVFVATTFIADGVYSNLPFLSLARQVFHGITKSRIFLSESELEDLCKTCGLVDYSCARNGPFVMISATKPH